MARKSKKKSGTPARGETSPGAEGAVPESAPSASRRAAPPRSAPAPVLAPAPSSARAPLPPLAGALIWVAIAAVLRLPTLGRNGLWFDEIHTLTESAFPKPLGAQHSTFYLLDSLFARLGPGPTVGVRIYPALAGIASVGAIFALASRLFSPAAGHVAAALVCFAPFHLFHSQEGRFYAPMFLFATLQLRAGIGFASASGKSRWAWAAALAATWYLGWNNHPAAAPFVLGHAIFLLAALPLTPWGMEAVGELAPVVRRADPRRARRVVLGVALFVGLAAAVALGDVRRQAWSFLSDNVWGATPGVDFTFAFFESHLSTFVWDLGAIPGLGALDGAVVALFAIVGLVALARLRPWYSILSAWLAFATFLAVFAFHREVGYFPKYVFYLAPIFVAATSAGVAAVLEKVPAPARRNALVAACVAVAVALAQTPGVASYFAKRKMPLRSQFHWIDRNAPEPAVVFVYGHAGFPASLYRGELNSIHALRWLPWVEDDGRLERSVMEGCAASGRTTYFAHAWPKDVPRPLLRWLNETARVAARFPSNRGGEFDGVLYEIPPPADPAARLSPDRRAVEVDDFGSPGRPRVVDGPDGPLLEAVSACRVSYRMPLKGGTAYAVELEVECRDAGVYFATVAAGREQPVALGGELTPGARTVWHGILRPAADGDELRLHYASDYTMMEADLGLRFARVTVREFEGDPPPGSDAERFPFGKFRQVGLPWDSGGGTMANWMFRPGEMFRAYTRPGEDFARIRVGEFAPDRPIARILSPQFQTAKGDLLFLRTFARLDGAYGLALGTGYMFFDAAGTPIAQVAAARTSLGLRVDWDPWTAPLGGDTWMEVQNVLPVPEGAAYASTMVQVWASAGQRRVDDAANEIHLLPMEIAALRKTLVE